MGKTSFIRYLLGRDFPGMHIGPEPTTDRFIAVMHGTEDKTTPGNALAVSPNMPFRGLEMFGNGFLSKFQGAQLDVPLLHHVTLIDTPGILSGEKQRIGRTYEFTSVIEWFAARCDVILLLFDAHKLDISDEFRNAIEALKGHDDKIRVVLNKADMVDAQKLIRIYGALMWSLGKVVKTPECVRVYIGSFWEQPLQCNEWSKDLLQREVRRTRGAAARGAPPPARRNGLTGYIGCTGHTWHTGCRLHWAHWLMAAPALTATPALTAALAPTSALADVRAR